MCFIKKKTHIICIMSLHHTGTEKAKYSVSGQASMPDINKVIPHYFKVLRNCFRRNRFYVRKLI